MKLATSSGRETAMDVAMVSSTVMKGVAFPRAAGGVQWRRRWCVFGMRSLTTIRGRLLGLQRVA